ncbi:hypothetical protein [Escherichia phage BF17]|nr:hypothetical protein [Escherichia phage BF17]
MKEISNQEYLALFRKNNHKYMALDSRTDISELEKKSFAFRDDSTDTLRNTASRENC